jgi:multidrug efflux pump
MTSLAFIAGTMPLALATGAGANSRISIGTGIVGGTLTATLLAVFLVPLFFVVVRRLFARRQPAGSHDGAYRPAAPGTAPHTTPVRHA